MALTEKNSLESLHTAICAADMAAASSVTSRRALSKGASHGRVHRRDHSSGGGGASSRSGVDDIDTDVGPSRHPTIESTRRRSSRVSSPIVFPVRKRHSDEHEGDDGEGEEDDGDEEDKRDDSIDESDDDASDASSIRATAPHECHC